MRRLLWCAPAALSALLLWAAYPPMGEVCALVFALAPLLVVARVASPKAAAWSWFAGGFLFWAGTLAWMPAIVKNNGPLPLVILGWAGLAALCAAYFAAFGWLSARAWRRFGKGALACEPLLWAGLEWVRSWLFTGFAWNFLGTGLADAPALAAPARLGGVYLVSALVVLLNGVFATLACRLLAPMVGEEKMGAWRPVAGWRRALETALPLGAILLAFGLSNATRPNDVEAPVPLRVALVQRNAPCIFRAGAARENPEEVFGRLLDVAAAARPDLVVWAESALAEFGPVGGAGAARAARLVADKTGGGALLAGGDWKDDNGKVYNAAALYAATNVQVYAKQHLVPFGEYIPFDKWITPLQRLSPIGVSLWPGEARTVALRTRAGAEIALAPLICYEDTDPVLARRTAKLGAQAIVLITNDSWFSHSIEPVQHAAQAVLRAIETGLPVVRVGNSGVTGLILPSGRARWLEDGEGKPLVDAAGTMVEHVLVAPHPVLTPYARLGDLPLAVLFAALLIALALPRRRTA